MKPINWQQLWEESKKKLNNIINLAPSKVYDELLLLAEIIEKDPTFTQNQELSDPWETLTTNIVCYNEFRVDKNPTDSRKLLEEALEQCKVLQEHYNKQDNNPLNTKTKQSLDKFNKIIEKELQKLPKPSLKK